MTRTMYDAVEASNLPSGGDIYLYYVDGIYANKTAVINRTPGKIHVPCTIGLTPARRGLILDVEKGDATNTDAVNWCAAYPGSNADLTIYTNSNNFTALKSALKGLSTQPNIIVANYDGVAKIPTGCIGKQFRGDVAPGFDQSVIEDYWPGVDAAPVKPSTPMTPVVFKPKVNASPVGDMLIVQYPRSTPGKTYTWRGDFLLTDSGLAHIDTLADEVELNNAGVNVTVVSYQTYLNLGGKS